MSAQARAAGRVEIGVAVDHEQVQRAGAVEDGAQRREFPQVELSGTVRRGFGRLDRPFVHQPREPRVGGDHHGRAGGTPVVVIRGGESPVGAEVTGLHPYRMGQDGPAGAGMARAGPR